VLFWSSLIVIVYAHAGYPLLLWIVARFRCLKVQKERFQPHVSVVMSLFNEEARVKKRLENLFLQDYPRDRLEVIVISDGSTDTTCDIVRSFAGAGVRLLDLGTRNGKALALNRGIAIATGEIIVFADARQSFESDAISQLVANFSDPGIGCVSGELVFVKDETSRIQAEMGAYWSYEKWIRKMESRSGSVVGATGAIYAIRRSLFEPLPAGTILDDVLTPLNIVRQGYRCIFDGSSVAFDAVSKDAAQELQRKVRTLAGNWQLLSFCPALLLPWRNPCWWRFLSHKVMRLVIPLALCLLLVSGGLLEGWFYWAFTVMQSLVYVTALVGVIVSRSRRVRIVNLCYFFLIMNAATVAGFWQWFTGQSGATWKQKCAEEP
jgi:biofilm PGA synthesis N-glycosyltransferase PgaC